MERRERFELLLKVESELAKRADKFGILSLSDAERVYLRACWAKGALDCNGFPYFFLGPCDAEDAAIAFEQMELPAAADAVRKATDIFPDGRPFHDVEESKRWMEQQGQSLIERWNSICEPIWDISAERFDEALAKYLVGRKDEFDLETDISILHDSHRP